MPDCLRCLTLDQKWNDLYATRVALLIELELTESQLSAVEHGLAAHDATNHEDPEEGCGDPECDNCEGD